MPTPIAAMNVIVIVETMIAFVVAITLHEAAQAAMGTVLGDETAMAHGRLSFAPGKQLAPIGTIVAVALSFHLIPAGLGWGRPIDMDARRMRVGPNTGTILVAVAGPVMNALVGVAVAVALHIVPGYNGLAARTGTCGGLGLVQGQALQSCLAAAQPVWALRIEQFAFILAVTNITIALVNILPLHPLDGYYVLFALLPAAQAIRYRNWMPYMELALLVIFFVVPYLFLLAGIAGFSPADWFAGWAYHLTSGITGQAYDFYRAL